MLKLSHSCSLFTATAEQEKFFVRTSCIAHFLFLWFYLGFIIIKNEVHLTMENGKE